MREPAPAVATPPGLPGKEKFAQICSIIDQIADTLFVPLGLRGNRTAILACVLTGRERGVPMMEATQAIYMVDGRPCPSAKLMNALVRRAGHSIQGEVDSEKATVRDRRADNGDQDEATLTIEMARRVGLLKRPSWQRYPEAMLWARAVSWLCRRLFADAIGALAYTPDEVNPDQQTGPPALPPPQRRRTPPRAARPPTHHPGEGSPDEAPDGEGRADAPEPAAAEPNSETTSSGSQPANATQDKGARPAATPNAHASSRSPKRTESAKTRYARSYWSTPAPPPQQSSAKPTTT